MWYFMWNKMLNKNIHFSNTDIKIFKDKNILNVVIHLHNNPYIIFYMVIFTSLLFKISYICHQFQFFIKNIPTVKDPPHFSFKPTRSSIF